MKISELEKILLIQNDKKQLIEEVITGELKDENIINKLKTNEILNFDSHFLFFTYQQVLLIGLL